jgi:geranylgeranyl diphosphate synthase, type I
MNLDEYKKLMRPRIEEELQKSLDYIPEKYLELREMLTYHMGWSGEGSGQEAQGKRIRPLLVLLSTAAAGGWWEKALPAACAVELVHNFSLIHDDIQDNSDFRRGRKTVWVKWGIAQAINAGDLMFTLAHLAMLRLSEYLPADKVLRASELLQKTAVQLTVGQYLDMSYEKSKMLPMEDYYAMIGGKTASLLSCCTELGSITAGNNPDMWKEYSKIGYTLGLAFQIQDDWLGIWGDEEKTGKSAQSDLVTGKKTLPILYALGNDPAFRKIWYSGKICPEDTPELKKMLSEDGTETYTKKLANQLNEEALQALEKVTPENDDYLALKQLILSLLNRQF